jgi:hypothetical protein
MQAGGFNEDRAFRELQELARKRLLPELQGPNQDTVTFRFRLR